MKYLSSLGAMMALVGVLACGHDSISVTTSTGTDYGQQAVVTAVDKFVAGGRTDDGFETLVAEARRLLPEMDQLVAAETERKLLALALDPVEKAMQTEKPTPHPRLATSVWSFGLSPAFSSHAPDGRYDQRGDELVPLKGETDDAYLLRICDGPMAVDCRTIVPEKRAQVVAALAVRHYMIRARSAVAGCYECRAEPAWAGVVARWEALDAEASRRTASLPRLASPSRWPAAGSAATNENVDVSATLASNGDLIVDGVRIDAHERIEALKGFTGKIIGLQVEPVEAWGLVRPVLLDAVRAGTTILLDARIPAYPWELRRYRVAPDAGASDVEPTQVVLRTLDYRRSENKPD